MSPDLRRATVHGGGPAGLIAALLLARKGSEVTLFGRAEDPRHNRIDVLDGRTFSALGALGLAEEELRKIAQPCPGVLSHWGAEGAVTEDYVTRPYGQSWAIERVGLVEALRRSCLAAGVWFAPIANAGPTDAASVETPRWRITATGRMAKTAPDEGPLDHDEIIALVARAAPPVVTTMESRLIVEAARDGWLYAIAGPSRSFCVGIITDRQSLAGHDPQAFAVMMLRASARISAMLAGGKESLTFTATPVPCRWRPVRAQDQTLRVGDAQASYDPIAGRGLSEAVQRTIETVAALLAEPEEIDRLEAESRRRYERYAVERRTLYETGLSRFGTGFWSRRCAVSIPQAAVPVATPAQARRQAAV